MSEPMTTQQGFEWWMSEGGQYPSAILKAQSGGYLLNTASHAWRVWQACAALHELERADLVKERDQAKAQLVALALALNPVNRKQDNEGTTLFERVEQLAVFARQLGFINARPALWDEADDNSKAQDDLPILLDNYGPGEGTSVEFGLTGLGSARYTVLKSIKGELLQFEEAP